MYHLITNLEDIVQASKEQPVFIFVHNPSSPLSVHAKSALDMFLKTHPSVPAHLVVAEEQGNLISELAQRFRIQQESPQLLLLHNGSLAAVHHREKITLENIKKAFSEN